MMMISKNNVSGTLIAATAFFLWGCFPLYFKLLTRFDTAEIIVHRFLWTAVLAFLLLSYTRFAKGAPWRWVVLIKGEPKWLLWLVLTASCMFLNTYTYVWAVNHNQILEASFGYFICPLVSIFLAMVFLKEKLGKWQIVAILLACFGVLVELFMLGELPIVALVVAFSFAFYGLIHKQMPVLAIPALFIETLLLSPLLLFWLFSKEHATSYASFWQLNNPKLWLLMLSGPITLIPLTLYNVAIKKTAMITVSFLGYIAPSLVFLLGVFLYKEALETEKLMAFGFIWLGLFVFSIDLWRNQPAKTAAIVVDDVRLSE